MSRRRRRYRRSDYLDLPRGRRPLKYELRDFGIGALLGYGIGLILALPFWPW